MASDKSSPFIIEMGKVQVQVLGTSFNLRAYQDEEMIPDHPGGREGMHVHRQKTDIVVPE